MRVILVGVGEVKEISPRCSRRVRRVCAHRGGGLKKEMRGLRAEVVEDGRGGVQVQVVRGTASPQASRHPADTPQPNTANGYHTAFTRAVLSLSLPPQPACSQNISAQITCTAVHCGCNPIPEFPS